MDSHHNWGRLGIVEWGVLVFSFDPGEGSDPICITVPINLCFETLGTLYLGCIVTKPL